MYVTLVHRERNAFILSGSLNPEFNISSTFSIPPKPKESNILDSSSLSIFPFSISSLKAEEADLNKYSAFVEN